MASRAYHRGGASWRLILRRSVLRSAELLGAVLLGLGALFLALALATYHQTDPSDSTAAAGPVMNWLGRPGAWAAERVLFLFGPVGGCWCPCWGCLRGNCGWWPMPAHDDEVPLYAQHWVRPTAVLVVGMGLLACALSLGFHDYDGTLPASPGGIVGLLGAWAVDGLAGLLPQVVRVWVKLGVGLLVAAGGAVAITRVFAIDWGRLIALTFRLKRGSAQGMRARASPRRERAPRVAAQDDEDAPDLPFTPDARPEAPAAPARHPPSATRRAPSNPPRSPRWRGRATCLTAASCPRWTC
jgi:S-DNA-T family DNA segregation ATPase FtsK/SpoIIIE